MKYLTHQKIDPTDWHLKPMSEHSGASVEFLGVVRRTENDKPITYLEYEAYEPMAERMLDDYIRKAVQLFGLSDVYFLHRVGQIPVGEIAVIIGVHAPHRAEAFAGCQYLIESLKTDVPIWKVRAV